MMHQSLYHSLLKIGALTLACVLVFESGLVSIKTEKLADNAGKYLANAIGVTVGVKPTELNTYTAELTKMEQDLKEREAALEEREIAVNLSTEETGATGGGSDLSTYILSTILFILLVLIVLNYILDFIRARNRDLYEGPPSLAS